MELFVYSPRMKETLFRIFRRACYTAALTLCVAAAVVVDMPTPEPVTSGQPQCADCHLWAWPVRWYCWEICAEGYQSPWPPPKGSAK